MKTSPLDFILSTIVLTALALSAGLLVLSSANYLTTLVFPKYHPIIDSLFFLFIYGILSAITTRLILKLKPFTPGTYDMHSPLFTCWKLFTVIYEFGRGALLPFTVVFFKPVVAKLFGANIGKDIALGGHLVDPELITIGDEAIIGQDSVITAHTITSGYLSLAPVNIGPRATIGVNTVVMSGVEIGEGSVVTAGSVIPPDTKIPPFELWGGSPATKIKVLDAR